MAAQFYLDQLNPLRGLGQQELISLIERAQLGYYATLQWLYYHIEKRDPMVRATKRRLLSALGRLDWNIKVAATGADARKKAIAQKQAADLRAAYDQIGNLRAALNFLCLADLRGFAHLEKIYEGASEIVELRIVEQWFWCRQGSNAPWEYNRDARETNRGEPIDVSKFIIREVPDPVDEIFAELVIKRRVNDQDWDAFLEDYGVPPMFVVGPPGVPPDKERDYQRVAQYAVSRRRGYLPHGASLVSASAGSSGGTGIFKERLNYIDQQIVVAGTSGTLTVLAIAGSGTLAGGAQKEAFDQIIDAIAATVSEALQKQFDKPFFARTHPSEPVLAYFEFSKAKKKATSGVLNDAKTAAGAGFEMDAAELSERTGYKLRYVGSP